MKHLIIIGAPRSGKSTLSKILHNKYGYNILSLDSLVQGFVKNFPEIGITEADETKNSPILTPFVKTYIYSQTKWDFTDVPLLIEGTHMSPKDAVWLTSHATDKFKIVGMGFPSAAVDKKFAEIRLHDKPTDWTSKRSDDELKKDIEEGIAYSKWLQQECAAHGIEFLDTSGDRMPVLEKFLSDLS